jgi:serine/threonine protein kinase
MPPPTTVSQYVELIGKTGLFPEETLTNALTEIQNKPNPPQTIDQFIATAIRRGLITVFQSKQIRLGRYKKFVLNGKYRILELIGTGGMGAVYLCEHKFMRRLVAVKILPADKYDDPSNLERFVREARAVAALNHPNIVRAYDIDKAEGMHFLVMEYVDGSSLQEIVARFGPLDPLRAANCIAQGAVGLQHAGDRGLVHRDIKPGNLLVDRTGVVKLLDLGLARFFEPERDDKLTEKYDEKCVLGTADYLAPEQAVSNNVDVRADIYGLGGTLYFLLTGKSPVPDGNVTQKLLFHQKMEPVPVTEFRKDVPPGLLDVLTKMMRKNPADRYQTPIEVAEALAPWAEKFDAVPAEFEMPDLCPAVTALVGHSLGAKPGVAGGSGSVKFVMPRKRAVGDSNGGKSQSGVALTATLDRSTAGSATGLTGSGPRSSSNGSSTVDFHPPRQVDQGSTIPNMAAVSPTTPVPKSALEQLDVRSWDAASGSAAKRSMSDICLTDTIDAAPEPMRIAPPAAPQSKPAAASPQRTIWFAAAGLAVLMIGLIVVIALKR